MSSSQWITEVYKGVGLIQWRNMQIASPVGVPGQMVCGTVKLGIFRACLWQWDGMLIPMGVFYGIQCFVTKDLFIFEQTFVFQTGVTSSQFFCCTQQTFICSVQHGLRQVMGTASLILIAIA